MDTYPLGLTEVILVDEEDTPIGSGEKQFVHLKGLLHRAFSVFIFNASGQLLLQQRAKDKYHSGGLWTNTCCGHPFPKEEIKAAAIRRLKEEMGLEVPLEFSFKFHYQTPFNNGLSEHEIDSVFIGNSEEIPAINPQEVMAYKYMSLQEIQKSILNEPQKYTTWFQIIFERFLEELKKSVKL